MRSTSIFLFLYSAKPRSNLPSAPPPVPRSVRRRTENPTKESSRSRLFGQASANGACRRTTRVRELYCELTCSRARQDGLFSDSHEDRCPSCMNLEEWRWFHAHRNALIPPILSSTHRPCPQAQGIPISTMREALLHGKGAQRGANPVST